MKIDCSSFSELISTGGRSSMDFGGASALADAVGCGGGVSGAAVGVSVGVGAGVAAGGGSGLAGGGVCSPPHAAAMTAMSAEHPRVVMRSRWSLRVRTRMEFGVGRGGAERKPEPARDSGSPRRPLPPAV
ncbi:hypothetical protein E8A74_23250 [Polyangium fumosum]|uniref:Uncharacterized protein n=1 Tax=Polyangium fumosum TaxID=889272 RepID=A0A4U1J987_9BACT|nr:hypothetical protein E8A74_23250 [Polyangium fumosum]